MWALILSAISLPIPGTSRRSFTLLSIPFLPPKCLSRACIFFAPRPSTSSSGSASAPFPLRFLWNALENLWASSRAWTSALPFLSSRIVSLPSCGATPPSLRALRSGTGPGAPSRPACSLWPIGASRPRRGVAGQATSCLLAHLDTASDIILRSSWASDLTL